MPKQISSSFLREVGDKIRQARASKGLTQRALGDRVGLPQSHVSKIEQGGVDLQLSSLVELARALDLELKLVPRQALPAVDGLIRASDPDKFEQSTRRAREALADQERLAQSLATAYPTLDEALKFHHTVKTLQGLRFDPAALKALRSALAPTRKIAEYLNTGDDRKQLLTMLERVNASLRHLRNTQVHGLSSTPPRQIPAHRLGEDGDD